MPVAITDKHPPPFKQYTSIPGKEQGYIALIANIHERRYINPGKICPFGYQKPNLRMVCVKVALQIKKVFINIVSDLRQPLVTLGPGGLVSYEAQWRDKIIIQSKPVCSYGGIGDHYVCQQITRQVKRFAGRHAGDNFMIFRKN